jgi:hypothetical protein
MNYTIHFYLFLPQPQPLGFDAFLGCGKPGRMAIVLRFKATGLLGRWMRIMFSVYWIYIIFLKR